MIGILLLTCVVIIAISLGAAVLSWKRFDGFITKHLSLLVSFSAGIFLVIAYQLGAEAFESSASTPVVWLWIAVGATGMWGVFAALPSFHHHHEDDAHANHHHDRLDARRIITSDALHNIGDGILLASAFSVSTTLGFATAVSILIHEIVQEISEFFVMRQAGYSVRHTLSINALVSLSILVGALGAWFLIDTFTLIEPFLLALGAGSFFTVVIFDLIPHSVRTSSRSKKYAHHIGWGLAGIVLMLMINIIFIHPHIDSEPVSHKITNHI